MSLEDIKEGEPYILVEGPRSGDTEFYGQWHLAASKAEALWKQALMDPSFETQIDRLLVVSRPDFGIAASIMFLRLGENDACFTIQTSEESAEDFAMMVEVGFFILTGQRYQMVIPAQLNMDSVKLAALKLAKTEDEEFVLHPESLVATMPSAEAKAWQRRLCDMDENHRCADRLLLLEDANGAG